MGTRNAVVVAACAAAVALAPAAQAAGGAQLLFQPKSALGTAITRQPDGKLVIGGDTGSGSRYAVARLSKTGRVDTKFGSKGISEVSVGSQDFGDLTQVTVESNGDILATGSAGAAGSQNGQAGSLFGIARLKANGKIDSGFHQNGRLLFTFGQQQDTAGWTIQRPDGNTVIGGDTDVDNTIYACAQVFDEGLNPVANLNSLCVIPEGTDAPTFGDAAAQPDNTTVVSIGGGRGAAPLYPVFGIGRLGPDGQPDASFGNQGFTVTDFGPFTKDLNQTGKRLLRARPDGGWLVAGSAPTGFGIVGFDAQGAIDPAFGTGGKLLVNADGTSRRDILVDVVPLKSGKFMAVGQTEKTSAKSGQSLELVRFTAAGKLDTSFGKGGRLLLSAAKLGVPDIDQIDAALGNPDGSLIVVGASYVNARRPGYAMLVVKLTPSGKVDRRFGR